MANATLAMVLTGESAAEILEGLRKQELLPAGRPQEILVGTKEKPVTDDWFELAQRTSGKFRFEDGFNFINVRQPDSVQLSREKYPIRPEELTLQLAAIRFMTASLGSIHHSWRTGKLGERYYGPIFEDSHHPLGWGCAFRGAGHERMVSRRWLAYGGPWRTLSGDPETTLVQFHDLEADDRTALAQAKAGHARLIAGFLPSEDQRAIDLEGLYSKGQKKLIVTVSKRNVSQDEMRAAVLAKRQQSLGNGRPLDNVVFVFLDEANAGRHAEELWLHELELRVIDSHGMERRIDENFVPSVERPFWAV